MKKTHETKSFKKFLTEEMNLTEERAAFLHGLFRAGLVGFDFSVGLDTPVGQESKKA